MELFDQIRKISFVFFFILGLAHFLSGLFYINGYAPQTSGLINRVLFIPFVITTLAYFLSSLKCRLLEYGKDSKTLDYALLTAGIVIFIILLGIELLAEDSPTPLIYPKL